MCVLSEASFVYLFQFVEDLWDMQNDAGEYVDMYIPRKWLVTVVVDYCTVG